MRPKPTPIGILRAALAVPAACLLLSGTAHAGSAPPPGSVPPDQDPFYAAPANIGTYAPGAVVGSRPVTPHGVNNVTAWQISYRTNDSHNQAELAVTTLMVPTAAWTGSGPRPVVSEQAAEDSTGTQCAPSYQLSSGSGFAVATTGFVQPLVDKGWAVAMPDFEGPKSVFMAGIQAGHAVLDGIRAVRAFGEGGVGTDNPWALNGYSGGAEATGWAAQLQPSYAPEIHLAGAAMGGIPADPAAVARSLDGGLFSGFEAAATASFDAEYPEAGIDSITNAAGKAALQQARGKCLTDLLASFAFKHLSDYTTVSDQLSYPPIAAMLRQNTLGAAAPATPIFDYHADTDEIVPVAQDDTLVKTWCTEGATVQKLRDPIGEHALEALLHNTDALNFLASRFAAKTPTDNC